MTTRKNIEQIRSVNEDARIFGTQREMGYDEYELPEIKSLLYQGNVFPELIIMPPPVLNREG
jgi:hypothetical protein